MLFMVVTTWVGCFGHGCSGHVSQFHSGRCFGLGMDATNTARNQSMDVLMLSGGCSGQHMQFRHRRYDDHAEGCKKLFVPPG